MEQCKCSTQIRGLTVRKRDGVIIHDVTLDVHHGEIMAIIGRNGAGKTTLLKALLGRIPYTGSITFTNPKGERVEKPRIGYVPQNMVIWLGHKKEKLARAGAMLQKVGGKNLLQKQLGNLSGGEMQRVLLAFALEPMPDMLLLDEPVSAVDRKGIEVFYDLVTSLRSEYHMPVILVSHDLSHVARYATRAALLDRTILVSGDVKTVMASPQVRETFGLDVVGGARA